MTEELPLNERVFIKGETISTRFKGYVVETSHEDIMDNLNKYWDETLTTKEIEGMAVFCYKSIMQYSDEELDEMFLQSNEKWDNWCNDILLFHIYRKKIDPNYSIPTFQFD
jgi:hypothetical protein